MEDSDDLSDITDLLDKRNFHLALSITNGQELAHVSGFAVPSEEVQKHEIIDIMSKWLHLQSLGLIDEIHKCASWIVETTSKVNGFSPQQEAASLIFSTSFAIATVIHLLDKQVIDYTDKITDSDEQSIDFIKKIILGD